MEKPSIYFDSILLIAAVIWGFAFVAQRMGMEFIGPFTYTAVRFSLGCLVLIIFLYFRNFATKSPKRQRNLEFWSFGGKKSTEQKRIILLQVLLGLILFCGISFQQYGLQFTTSGNAGFITGFYVVLVPIAGMVFGHRNHFTIWIGVILAIAGLYFLSVKSDFTINPGDYYVSICALFWTAHVLLVGYIAPKTDPVMTALVQFAICSVMSWFVAIGFESISWEAIIKTTGPILYGGVLSVGIGYTLQVVAQQKAHPAYASIILSLESVFAVLGGWLILDEHLSGRMILGCCLMLTGMVAVQTQNLTSSTAMKNKE
jgi:drug/metabolite transporter (DMT)-like permease